MELTELATELVAQREDVSPEDVDGEQLRQCQIALYHRHLPKLAEADIISFASSERTVTLNESVPAYLSAVLTPSDPVPKFASG